MGVPSGWACLHPISNIIIQKKVIHVRNLVAMQNQSIHFLKHMVLASQKENNGWSLTKWIDVNVKFIWKPRTNTSCASMTSWKNSANNIFFMASLWWNWAIVQGLAKNQKKSNDNQQQYQMQEKKLKL